MSKYNVTQHKHLNNISCEKHVRMCAYIAFTKSMKQGQIRSKRSNNIMFLLNLDKNSREGIKFVIYSVFGF